jgi:predicted nucleic acid-binding protein
VAGNKALFDGNIIIYLSKRELSLSFIEQFDGISVSVITYMEILGFDFPNSDEEIFIRELLSNFTTIFIDQKIADTVVSIRKKKLPVSITFGLLFQMLKSSYNRR